MMKKFIGFIVTGYIYGGGGYFESVPRDTFEEAWDDSVILCESSTLEVVNGVKPVTTKTTE